jgi:hypothetical protein
MFARLFSAMLRSFRQRQAELQDGMRHLEAMDRRRN